MKRIICLLCALICVVGALTACENKTKTQSSDKPVETQTENIKPNEPFEKNEATEATETTETTEVQETTKVQEPTTAQAKADYKEYTDPKGRWSVKIPNDWYKYGDVIENEDSVKFVYKKSYTEYGAGHVFTIFTVPVEEKVNVSDYPKGKELYIDNSIQVYVLYPTDVQFGGINGENFDTEKEEYKFLSNLREEIIDSFTVHYNY